MTTARPGPVSSATLRPQDLLEAFASCLKDLAATDEYSDYADLIAEAQHLTNCSLCLDSEYNADDVSEVINELVVALNNYADEGYYFGGHPGDGAEFGFYPIDEDDF